VLACPRCGGWPRLIATPHDPAAIRKILAHLDAPDWGRALVPPRLRPDPILEYNCAHTYALSVALLADRLK